MATSAFQPDWTPSQPSSLTPPYSVFTKPIEKSEQDNREYRLIQLANGLQATVVRDPNADKAAASLDVAVGHLYDPDDMPGLAHFCEHLLFMGTEQFPRENEYSEFLAKNNGGSNAYTSTSNTNYYFSVATPALAPALARFAAFFHCPLFSPSCTSRELNAVDSEHKKNHQSDMWRIFQLNKHLSRPGHVWIKFGSGNKESLSKAGHELKNRGRLVNGYANGHANGNATGNVNGNATKLESATSSLAPSPNPSRIPSPAPSAVSSGSESEADGGAVGRETRRRLIEWWSKEYCASRMRLCVIGSESLDELSELVSKLFSPTPNRGREALPMITEHPFGPNEMGTQVSVQTIMSFHAVEISFPLEYQPPFWRHKPANFLSHFVGHEGPGSLFSYLKNKGWVTSLSSGPQNLARGFAMFKVTIHLTDEGFKQNRDVTLATFKYLSLLRSSEFPAWHQREVATISRTRFRFAEKRRPDDYTVWVSEHMAWPVPRELILAGPQLTWEWDEGEDGGEKKMRETLDGLRVTRGRAVLMAKGSEHEKLRPGANWEKEPWYGTEYKVERFDEEFVREAEAANDIPDLRLPGPNEFIPTDLDVDKRDVSEPAKRPHLVRKTALSSLWHKKDDKFWVPKAHVVVDLRSPISNATAKAAVLTKLYSDLVTDALSEYSYDADLAGLQYNCISHTGGLYVALNGYNDKMPILVHHVLEKIKTLAIDPERFAVMREQAKKNWENFFLGQSYQLSEYYARYLLTEQQWTHQEKLAVLPSVTIKDLQRHIAALLIDVHAQILIAGNLYKDEAMKIAGTVETSLQPTSAPQSALIGHSLVVPPASNYTWVSTIPNPNQANSALTYYLNFGPITDQRLRVASALLAQILHEPAFNVLRTKEQLGYIVFCSQWLLTGSAQKGLRITVQSEKLPGYLEDRVEAFLDGMKAVIEEMPEDQFEEQKQGLERKWLEADKNLSEETSRYLTQIQTGHLDFLRNEADAKLLQEVTKKDVLTLFLTHVHPSSPSRAKLSVHMRSQKPRPPKISHAAAQAFEVLAQSTGVLPEDAQSWKDTLGKEDAPISSADFTKHWVEVFGKISAPLSQEKIQEFVTQMQALAKKYPVEGEDEDQPRPGVIYFEDASSFKSSLQVAPDPGPMVQWDDLPTPKF
ncbi:hypothetical protein BDN71DRAFT_1447054 [Pleurotus eryngii]|uniref:Insulin-degrading enzyme n=1 Tax=Pleurotus eryngii TaxID=5323 RepID=A0A9P6DH11_PLEER|nr:hypothetical protein BDN71DRAFT_1447054 [Pleurotus eryngii]